MMGPKSFQFTKFQFRLIGFDMKFEKFESVVWSTENLRVDNFNLRSTF